MKKILPRLLVFSLVAAAGLLLAFFITSELSGQENDWSDTLTSPATYLMLAITVLVFDVIAIGAYWITNQIV